MSNLVEQLKATVRSVPDFPIPGILFRDISPIFLDPNLLQACPVALADPWREQGITKVVGIDSRGFLFGPQMAVELGAGFVMIRKKGKLPPETISVSYSLEYGEAELESVATSIEAGDRVLIHDDLLATGGTAAAAASLVKKLGGEVVGFSFIIHLTYLPGQEAIEPHSESLHALLAFEE